MAEKPAPSKRISEKSTKQDMLDAYQKVQIIAEKTVEGSSQSRSLAELQELLLEQGRRRQAVGPPGASDPTTPVNACRGGSAMKATLFVSMAVGVLLAAGCASGPKKAPVQDKRPEVAATDGAGINPEARGTLSLINADVRQVLALYSGLTGTELEMPKDAPVPRWTITLEDRSGRPGVEIAKLIEAVLRDQAGVVLTHLDGKRVAVSYDDSARNRPREAARP